MVSESKYTSLPNKPWGSNVAAELTMKVTQMPNATGKSMLMRACFKSRQAALVNISAAKNMTGKVSTHEAQRSKDTMLGVMSSGEDT